MFQKSASKSLIKLEPIRSADTEPPPTPALNHADANHHQVILHNHSHMKQNDLECEELENANDKQFWYVRKSKRLDCSTLTNFHHLDTIFVAAEKMLKKSASKALIKLEPLRNVENNNNSSSAAKTRKTTNNECSNTLSAVTSITEVSDKVLQELDDLVKNANNNTDASCISAQILKMCKDLKAYGHILERKDSMQMDRYFVFLRDAAQDQRFDAVSRLRLLEIIELRASGWKGGDGLDHFYKSKFTELENNESLSASVPSVTTCALSPTSPTTFNNPLPGGDVLKSSGKFGKPAKIPSKNYYKDEIVIHNADSGKVMGIKGRRVHMIEELSGTIVSFQRVLPGAKDRLVQITGPSESAVAYAQQLIEETIVRNTSPIRERGSIALTESAASALRKTAAASDTRPPALLHSMSMNDASLGEYQYTVNVGHDLIKLTGSRLDVIRTAKLVLEEYFAGDAKRTAHQHNMAFDELLSDEDLLSSSPSPTGASITNPGRVLSRSASLSNGHRLTKAARITGRCVAHHKYSDDDDDDRDSESNSDDDPLPHEHVERKDEGESVLISAAVLGRRIKYRREFLLDCARSPYSQSTPKCLAKIIQENPTILKKSPEFFDAVSHQAPACPLELSGGRSWSSRGGSQEIDDSAVTDNP